MDRTAELLSLIGNTKTETEAKQLVDEIIFLEDQLKKLKRLPFLRVNPKNPEQQKATPAAKQYKELLQQYNNSLKLLLKITGDLGGEPEEESPLRQWLRERMG